MKLELSEPIPYMPFSMSQGAVQAIGTWNWNKIRFRAFIDSEFKCRICGVETKLECHKVWRVNDKTKTIYLKTVYALCKGCHDRIGWGVGLGATVLSHCSVKEDLDYRLAVAKYPIIATFKDMDESEISDFGRRCEERMKKAKTKVEYIDARDGHGAILKYNSIGKGMKDFMAVNNIDRETAQKYIEPLHRAAKARANSSLEWDKPTIDLYKFKELAERGVTKTKYLEVLSHHFGVSHTGSIRCTKCGKFTSSSSLTFLNGIIIARAVDINEEDFIKCYLCLKCCRVGASEYYSSTGHYIGAEDFIKYHIRKHCKGAKVESKGKLEGFRGGAYSASRLPDGRGYDAVCRARDVRGEQVASILMEHYREHSGFCEGVAQSLHSQGKVYEIRMIGWPEKNTTVKIPPQTEEVKLRHYLAYIEERESKGLSGDTYMSKEDVIKRLDEITKEEVKQK